jgi:hypothetical protein
VRLGQRVVTARETKKLLPPHGFIGSRSLLFVSGSVIRTLVCGDNRTLACRAAGAHRRAPDGVSGEKTSWKPPDPPGARILIGSPSRPNEPWRS